MRPACQRQGPDPGVHHGGFLCKTTGGADQLWGKAAARETATPGGAERPPRAPPQPQGSWPRPLALGDGCSISLRMLWRLAEGQALTRTRPAKVRSPGAGQTPSPPWDSTSSPGKRQSLEAEGRLSSQGVRRLGQPGLAQRQIPPDTVSS